MPKHVEDRPSNPADKEEQPHADLWEEKTPWQKYKARRMLGTIILSDPAPPPPELLLIADLCKSFFRSRR